MGILADTKKILNIDPSDTAFDLDILTHINSTLGILSQMGVGPSGGFFIEDDGNEWDELLLPGDQLALVRTYLYLKVRMLFDPPGTSYLVEAMEKQINEHEHRLILMVEGV
jgi:hypothetical protein